MLLTTLVRFSDTMSVCSATYVLVFLVVLSLFLSCFLFHFCSLFFRAKILANFHSASYEYYCFRRLSLRSVHVTLFTIPSNKQQRQRPEMPTSWPAYSSCEDTRPQDAPFFCAVYRGLQSPFIMRLSDDKTSGALLRCYNRFFTQREGRFQPFVTFLSIGRKNTSEGASCINNS